MSCGLIHQQRGQGAFSVSYRLYISKEAIMHFECRVILYIRKDVCEMSRLLTLDNASVALLYFVPLVNVVGNCKVLSGLVKNGAL